MKTISHNSTTSSVSVTAASGNDQSQLVATPVPEVLFNAMNGNRAEMSPEAAGIAACLMTYSHHACRTECYAMTVHYYRLRDYALQHPECSAIMRIID
ncbi:TPA: antirestriction protein [Escherichia coli]|nr:antirestriction protein [Escherichia coli]HCQ4287814.1 antirestriction protein [Escherichia coli]